MRYDHWAVFSRPVWTELNVYMRIIHISTCIVLGMFFSLFTNIAHHYKHGN